MTTDELNFVLKARREKHDALIARGVAPYAYRFARTHTAAAAVAALGDANEGETVRVAGRIVAWRGEVRLHRRVWQTVESSVSPSSEDGFELIDECGVVRRDIKRDVEEFETLAVTESWLHKQTAARSGGGEQKGPVVRYQPSSR